MRLVVLAGAQPNQLALCNALHSEFEVAAIVLSRNVPRRRPALTVKARRLVNRVAVRTVGRRFGAAWQDMQARFRRLHPAPPPVLTEHVRNINDDATLRVIEATKPDLVVVSGTNLVGSRILEAVRSTSGAVNLHTGISPYVKGGPNCTNWCLAEGLFHLIGNTVMWMDAGIDTGAIIATERTPLDGSEDLSELHWKVMTHAHDLYVRAIRRLSAGQPVPHVPQQALGEGRTYYNADWTVGAMRRGLRNFDEAYTRTLRDNEVLEDALRSISLVSLDAA